jgi:AcrR family transcriptional regulator
VTTASAGSPRRAARQRLGEDERRADILRAAIVVVARDGFDGASTSKVAAGAGVSKGLIWHYFTDKGDLMKQTVATAVQVIQHEMATELDFSAPVADLIRASIAWLATASRKYRDEFAAMDQITRNLRAPDGTPAFSLADYEDVYQAQEALFRRGQDEGSFRDFDTRVMAVTYQGAIDMMRSYIDSHPETDTARYADALADILLAAMRVPPAGEHG